MTFDSDNLKDKLKAEMADIYSPIVIDHALHPRNTGDIHNANGFSKVISSCGDDTMEIWLKVENKIIKEAVFRTDACAATIAVGSMVTELAKGRRIVEAMRINEDDILKALGGLPTGNEHCATLAVAALHEAVKSYLEYNRDPWKLNYRKNL